MFKIVNFTCYVYLSTIKNFNFFLKKKKASRSSRAHSKNYEWFNIRNIHYWTSLVVQWLRLRTSNAGGVDLIPGPGTNIPHATPRGQKKKERNIHYCNSSHQ